MKYLVTGVSGSGKTTLAAELRKRGYRAYNGDKVSGLGRWVDAADKPVKVPKRLTKDWISKNSWKWDEARIKKLLGEAEDVVICGASSNIDDFYPLFDKVFLLKISIPAVKKRLRSRPSGFGKFKQEHQLVLEWHEWFENHHLQLGAIEINADEPKQSVARQVIRYLDEA